jgi:hypothetical protein
MSYGRRHRGAAAFRRPVNKRFLRVIALGFGWLVIAALVPAILFPLQVTKFQRIGANSRTTTGFIVDKFCCNNGQVTYTFDVDGKRYGALMPAIVATPQPSVSILACTITPKILRRTRHGLLRVISMTEF